MDIIDLTPSERRTFRIETNTPPDATKAFRRVTTYVTGRWVHDRQVFAFHKVAAGDEEGVRRAVAACERTAALRLIEARPGFAGAGI